MIKTIVHWPDTEKSMKQLEDKFQDVISDIWFRKLSDKFTKEELSILLEKVEEHWG